MWTRAFAIIVAAVAAAVVAVAPSAKAAPKTDDCVLTITPPVLTYGVFVATEAALECKTVKHTIEIDLELLQDGVVVGTDDERAHKRSTWHAYTVVNDPPGNQTWCVRVTALYPPYTIGPVTSCASEPF